MFPRDDRKTRSTSRSSFVSTSRSLQTGQLSGGLRVSVRATLFDRHADAAESAVDVERAGAVPELGLVAARVGDPLAFNGDIAHRGSRGDAHAGPAGEAHSDLSHVAADGARARVELA